MWPRVVEVMLGAWLMMGPFIFPHAPGAVAIYWVDLVGGLVIASVSLLTWMHALRRLHLLHLVLGPALVAYGWFTFPGPASQNHIATGLLLTMIAIIPPDTLTPPEAWQAPRQST